MARVRWPRHQVSAAVLTWPGDRIPTVSEYHYLRRRLMRLFQLTPGAEVLTWKLEFQARGAPHLNLSFRGLTGRQLVDWWLENCPGTNRKGQWSQPIKSASQWSRYLADATRKKLDNYQHQLPASWAAEWKTDPDLPGIRWWWTNPDYLAPAESVITPAQAALAAARPHRLTSQDATWQQIWPILRSRILTGEGLSPGLIRMLLAGTGRIYGPLQPGAP